jgi:hypothetical protein
MDIERGVVAATAIVIVAVAVATGPLGLVGLSTEELTTPETGNATISVGTISDTATLTAGQQGTDFFVFHTPDATIEVSDLRGNPILEYSLDIEVLGYKRTSVYFLDSHGEGQLTLSFNRDTLDSARIDRDSYDATLAVTLRGETERTVFERPVTVEVQR